MRQLGGERQFAGGGFVALANFVGPYGGLRRKDSKSITARWMHLADQKCAQELMITSAEKRTIALE